MKRVLSFALTACLLAAPIGVAANGLTPMGLDALKVANAPAPKTNNGGVLLDTVDVTRMRDNPHVEDKANDVNGNYWLMSPSMSGAREGGDTFNETLLWTDNHNEDVWVELHFTGRQAVIYGKRDSWHVEANVYINGNRAGDIANFYAPSTENDALIFDTGSLNQGKHVIRIVQSQRSSIGEGDARAVIAPSYAEIFGEPENRLVVADVVKRKS